MITPGQQKTQQATSDGADTLVPPWLPKPRSRYRGWRLQAKWTADAVVAVILLTATTPVLLAIGMAVVTTSRGPALYRQQRVGQYGQEFTVLKFRSMRADSEKVLASDAALYTRYRGSGFKLGLNDDPRITRFGRFIRRTSLDELPQLLNVLRGEMSLVGPRPIVPDELAEYGPFKTAYLMARPGITGQWQVSGRDAVKYPERAELDARYLDTWSLAKDLRIALRTIPVALRARGVG